MSAESSLLELCRATQHFDDGTSKCKGTVKREDSQIYLRKTEREFLRWWNIIKNAKEWAQNTKLAWGYAERRSISMMGHQNTKSKICGVLAENDAIDGGHQQKSLHPSRRMTWKKLRHGVAVFFLSPRKKTQHSSPNHPIPINFYKISKNNSVFILLLQNKVIPLQCYSGQQNNNH